MLTFRQKLEIELDAFEKEFKVTFDPDFMYSRNECRYFIMGLAMELRHKSADYFRGLRKTYFHLHIRHEENPEHIEGGPCLRSDNVIDLLRESLAANDRFKEMDYNVDEDSVNIDAFFKR